MTTQQEASDDRFDDPTVATPTSNPLVTALTSVVLPGAIVVLGLFCAGVMIVSKPAAERSQPAAMIAEVTVRPVEATTRNASIQGTGQVRAAQSVRLTPQIQGSIVSVAPGLAPGSRFAKGDVLASIDARDYRAAVAAQEQAVAQAELNLATEISRGELAKKEWLVLGKQGQAGDLTLRLPHLHAAEKGLEAAQAALEQARANLARTQIRAPFNGILTEESLEVGQLVGPNVPVATINGTDAFWVDVSMPVEKLDGISFPNGEQPGSAVEVVQKLGAGKEVIREGRVLQLGGQLDPQSRTATVLVEIPDPFAISGLPMLPGASVTVGIDGKAMQDTWEIEREFVDQGTFVWMVDREGALRRRTIEVAWRTPTSVIVSGGIEDGDRLVVSPLILPVDGQTVTARGEEG